MKTISNVALSVILILTISSCKRIFEDEELSMKRTDYTGDELRTDGYYYWKSLNPEENQQYNAEMKILYRNGVFITSTRFGFTIMEKKENDFKNGEFYSFVKEYKTQWGVYKISNNTICFEGWEYNSPGGKITYTEKGEILNDTTFRIYDGKDKEHDWIYHFKQFSPKPDSTNNFIK